MVLLQQTYMIKYKNPFLTSLKFYKITSIIFLSKNPLQGIHASNTSRWLRVLTMNRIENNKRNKCAHTAPNHKIEFPKTKVN